MKCDLINFSGEIVPRENSQGPYSMLLGGDFVYQRIHVMENTPLHIEGHNEIVIRALISLYGSSFGLSTEQLTQEILRLIDANNYQTCNVIVDLYVMPPAKGQVNSVNWLLLISKQLLYKGYVLWHSPLNATISRYEYALAEFPTAISLTSHKYAWGHAGRQGADVAITQNHKHIITGAGPFPFFAVSGNRIFTTPLEDGALDSVRRRLGIAACEKSGFQVLEQPIYTNSLYEYDEFFFVSLQGIDSIGTLNGNLYPTSAARVVANTMSTLTNLKLLMDETNLRR